jgi:glycosyltransferase involved in cell wall biosynthesis
VSGEAESLLARTSGDDDKRPHILIGVTSAQTCLVLGSRLRALAEAGFRVSLVSAPGSMAVHGSRIAGVAAYEIPMARAISPVADLVALVRMLRLLHRLKPDIVEFSTPKAGLLGSAAAWICGTPVRIYFLRGLRLETAPAIKRAILLWLERIAAGCAHAVVANSGSLRKRARALRICSEKKLVLLGHGSSNGVDLSRFAPGICKMREQVGVREQFGIPANAPVIGFVGRLTGDKGVPELVEAFARMLRERPECYLLLVGWFDAADDALGRDFRRRIEGHPRIVCTGYVDDAAPYYRAMDLLILPSWREGFPNAVLEAAASGVPVVATACTGSRDAVVPETTGMLVPPGDADAIANAALRILGDDELRGEMAVAARKWAVNYFDQGRVLGMTVRFYRRLLNSEASKASAQNEAVTGLSASL